MAKKLFPLVVLIVFLTTGCANQVPVAENFSISTQKKLRAPHHWDVIAEDVVTVAKKALDYNDDLRGEPVFVDFVQIDPFPFNQAYKNFMITGLVNRGILVTENPNAQILVRIDTQVVHHKGPRKYSPLVSTAISTNALQEKGRSEDHGSTSSALTDGPTRTELIVNTSILKDGNYRMRKSTVYYVDGEDTRLFAKTIPVPVVKDMEVVGQ
ncbi:hypothetical protein MASR1M90_15570 [Desulfovibrionales bacterium]